MISDIESGRINMVITKDLSRLGRDYIQTGYYLEKYFPLKRIRFVAINDGYDSSEEGYANEFAPFKSVFNDMYAKDISKKVRTSLKTKQLKGEYLGTTAPFGYLKDVNNKGKLMIDPISSKYVEDIFTMYLNGMHILAITKELTGLKIPTPSQYRNNTYTQKHIPGLWSDKAVRFILTNEVYIGNTVQNKRKKVNYKIKKQVSIPRSQWIVVQNTHVGIISKENFKKVQDTLAKRAYTKEKRAGKIHLLTGFTYCGNCGGTISFTKRYEKDKYYTMCSVAKTTGKKLHLCETSLIKEELVEEYISDELKRVAKQYVNQEEIIKKSRKIGLDSFLLDKQQRQKQLQIKVEQSRKIKMNLYQDKVNGIIDEKAFLELTEDLDKEKEEHELIIQKIGEEILELENKKDNDGALKGILKEFLKFEKLDRNILALLVEKVVIYLDKSIEIYFTFREPIR